jgi:hypothetical protein
MKNQTLHFTSLEAMSQFVKQLYGGYLLNTINCTITSCFPEYYLNLAINDYHATIVDPNIITNPYNKNIQVAA